MKASNNAERIGKVFRWFKGARRKIGWDPKETPGKRGELRKKPVNTGKTRSFGNTGKTGRTSGKSGDFSKISGKGKNFEKSW